MMFDWRRADDWWQLFKYYQAGVVNVLFGYGLFTLLLWLGLNVYVAQVLSHVLGVAFNYFTYSRYAFVGQKSSKIYYILSYGVNYILSLAALWLILKLIPSAYVAGAIATIVVSVINFFLLKRLVFHAPVKS